MDTDSRKKAEKDADLRQWHAIFDAITDAVCLIDTTGRILRFNAAFKKQCQKGEDEITGRRCHEIIHGQRSFIADCPLTKVLKSGRRENIDLEIEGRSFLVSVDPVFDETGAITSLVHIFRDISPQKRAEATLHCRLTYEKCLSECVSILAEAHGHNDLQQALKTLRQTADADRAYIFQNEEDPERGLCCSQILEDCAAGIQPQITNPLLRHISYQDLPSLWAAMGKRLPFAHRVHEIDGPEQALLASQEILSVLVLPIHRGEAFWGFVGFDDCRRARLWNEDDIRILGAVADSIGATLSRWQATEALQSREETYRALVDGLPDVVVRFDRNGRHLFLSKKGPYYSPIPLRDCLGKTHREIGFPEEQCRFWERAVKRVFDTGETRDAEITCNGPLDTRTYNIRMAPEAGHGGHVRSVLALLRDITEHRRAERHYRMLFNEMLNGFSLHELVCDPEGEPSDYRFLEVNPAFERLTGLIREQILGKNALELLPNLEPFWIETYARVTRTGEPAFFEHYSRELGKHFEVMAFRYAPGQFATIFQDISERKNAEERLRLSENLYRTLFDATALGVSIQDRDDFSYLEVNQAFLDLYGFTDKEIKGFLPPHFCSFVEMADESQMRLYLEQVENGEVVQAEIQERNSQGEPIWVSKTIRKVVIDGAERIMTFSQDVTERRMMQEFLIQTEKVMSLGVLAAGMAHEINNPLGIISQGVQNVLRRTREPLPGNLRTAQECAIPFEKIRCYLEKRNVFRSLEAIHEAVGRSAAIVSNMLEFSRKSDSRPAPLSLNRLLEKTIDLAKTDYDLKKKYDFRNIRIATDFALDLEVHGVASELEQVFFNLLRNSAQNLTQAGRRNPRILLHTRREGNWAVVEVEDNGTGIPPEIRPKIFDPFFTTKEVGQGTGLGLSISFHIIVQRHQGEMLVESEPGAWTRFILRLPLKPQPVMESGEEMAGFSCS